MAPRGFTIIELVVGVAIIITLTGLLVAPWTNGLQTFASINFGQQSSSLYLEAYATMRQNVRIAVDLPSTYTSPDGKNTYTAGGANGASTLILKLFSITQKTSTDSTGTYTYDVNNCNSYDYIVYQLGGDNGDELHEITYADANSERQSGDHVLVTGVDSLTFTVPTPSTGQHHTVTAAISVMTTALRRTIERSHTQTMVDLNDTVQS